MNITVWHGGRIGVKLLLAGAIQPFPAPFPTPGTTLSVPKHEGLTRNVGKMLGGD